MGLATNIDKVIKISVMGEIAHPITSSPFRLDAEGKPHITPGTGGITYNFALGDNAFDVAGDHIEPDVSTKNFDKEKGNAYMTYSCIGNEAYVISGDAKDEKGRVIGKHGGINHVLVYFPRDVKEKLAIGDKIQIKAWGQGLELEVFPNVKVFNIDPEVFEKFSLTEREGKIYFPVVAKIPGYLMGSGVGSKNPGGTDYDIITHDHKLMEKLDLTKLKIGDFVAIENHNNSFGVGGYKENAISIGVIVHSNCYSTGHGPGVVVIMTSPDPVIVPEIKQVVNLKNFF
ncbi:MAG: DUF4438 domain-containing protein [Kosmotogaceae bacterium]